MSKTKLIKKITPKGGIAKTPLEILKRAKAELEQDGRWVQGNLVCPVAKAGEQVEPDTTPEANQRVVDEIMRNGICGEGWGMCAMGGVALETGLMAVVDEPRYDFEVGDFTASRKVVASLVTEEGWNTYEDLHDKVPAVRRARYQKAGQALDAAANELYGAGSVVEINDHGDGVDSTPEKSFRAVLNCFDAAIEALEARA